MTYVLDNAHTAAATRLAILERLYDPLTRANLDAAYTGRYGAGPDTWEVGAGGGSVAAWLATERGARVTITDVDLRHLSSRAVESATSVLQHDVMTADPPGTFDLIHARLVLSHLPTPLPVIARLVDALRPGGWLCIEELDPMLGYQPAADETHLLNHVGRAFTRALASRGGDPTLGRRLHPILRAAGLTRVHAGGSILTGYGGGAIAELMRVNVEQTADLLAEQGITPATLEDYRQALGDPGQWITMPVFWAVRGRVRA
jgi:SAM-dependent methyltransferase